MVVLPLVLALAVVRGPGQPAATGALCCCHRLYSHLMLALALLLLLLLGVWLDILVLLLLLLGLKRMDLSALKTATCVWQIHQR
jgi:uncharacterized membrane protein